MGRHGSSLLKALLIGIALVTGATGASAQPYPSKTIKLIVPVAPGGTSDFLARVLAQAASDAWGQTVVVDNRPGAGGIIGLDVLARSRPDGYTVAIATGGLAIYPVVNKDVPFDAIRDFEYFGMVGKIPNILLVNAASPVKTFQELVENSKKGPGVPFGTTGIGSNSHMTGEMLKYTTGASLVHVPYRGGAPAMVDLLANNIPLLISGVTTAYPYVKNKQVRGLAVSTSARLEAFPDVPTLDEVGVKGIDTAEWFAVVAPRGTPPEVADRWRTIIAQVANSPKLKELSPAFESETSTREELVALVTRETALWKDVAAKARIVPQ